MPSKTARVDALVQRFESLGSFSVGITSDGGSIASSERIEQLELESLLREAENALANRPLWRLEYSVGLAYSFYARVFFKPNERHRGYSLAVAHLEKAFALSDGSVATRIPRPSPHAPIPIDRVQVALALGSLLVEIPQARDLERGVFVLRWASQNTPIYEPQLCKCIDGLYLLKRFREASEFTEGLLRRVAGAKDWHRHVEPGMRTYLSKCLRAEAKLLRKSGDLAGAVQALKRSVSEGAPSQNDLRLLENWSRLLCSPQKKGAGRCPN